MSGHGRGAIALALWFFSAAAASCGHAGPDTCGGYAVDWQWDKRFRLTVT
jgi:hypothetical protein